MRQLTGAGKNSVLVKALIKRGESYECATQETIDAMHVIPRFSPPSLLSPPRLLSMLLM